MPVGVFWKPEKSVYIFIKYLLKPSGHSLVLQAALPAALLVPHMTKGENALDNRNLSSPAAPANPNPHQSSLAPTEDILEDSEERKVEL